MSHETAEEVLTFWFGELRDGFADEAHRRAWFQSSPERDEEIRHRFGALLVQVAAGELQSWQRTPRTALALIIVCDQFSRQIHRGTAAAYATDPQALVTARELVQRGDDLKLQLDERVFAYMPFEHAESRVHQHASVGLFTALRDAAPADKRELTGGFLEHAEQHRDIVLRFGRFPHRNALLERADTEAERAFLATSGNFGQSP